MSYATPTPHSSAVSANWNEALVGRYDRSGPRDTSYPSALSFRDSIGSEELSAALVRSSGAARPLSLYVHIPFCRKVCFYCVRNKVATKDARLAESYLTRLDREMVLAARHLDTSRPLSQLYWGGGTPTYLSLDQMSDLIDRLHGRFGLSDDPQRDYAIEIDPREANMLTLRHLQALGFNRLSLGVQDLDLKVQKAINRIQPRVLTETLVDEARRLGFRALNMDLIYGLPHQTRDSFAATLEQVIDMAPARLSLYPYAHLPQHFAEQRRIDSAALPSAEETLAIALASITMLESADYKHIGMGHFARSDDTLTIAQRQGTLRRNFQGYTSHPDSDLLGLGVSAMSRIDDLYAQNPTSLSDYETALDAGRLPTQRGIRLTFDDRLRRYVIERLMCDMTLDLKRVGDSFGIDAKRYFSAALRQLETAERDGLIHRQGLKITATPLGKLLIQYLAMAFDAHLTANYCSPSSRVR